MNYFQSLSHVGAHGANYFLRLIEHYGLLAIFISHIVENIGIPFPTEGAFIVSQHFIQTGVHSFWFMYAFIVMAQICGAVIAYALGRAVNDWLKIRFKDHEGYQKANKSVTKWYGQYGSVTVLATRLIGYVRPWSSLIAGAAEFDFWPFLLWTTVGSMLFVYPSMKMTALVFVLWRRSPLMHLLISLSFLLSFTGLIIIAAIREHLIRNDKDK